MLWIFTSSFRRVLVIRMNWNFQRHLGLQWCSIGLYIKNHVCDTENGLNSILLIFFLDALITWTFSMLKNSKLERSHRRAIKRLPLYLSLNFCLDFCHRTICFAPRTPQMKGALAWICVFFAWKYQLLWYRA